MCGWDWTANRYPTAPMITLFMIKAASRAASLEEVVFMRFSIEKGCHLSSIVMKARAVPGADMRRNAASEAIFAARRFRAAADSVRGQLIGHTLQFGGGRIRREGAQKRDSTSMTNGTIVAASSKSDLEARSRG
jgi:hypothetical protein